jgi:tryptophan-rich sensory protein
VGFLGLCLLVGIAAGALTAGPVHVWYDALARPPGTPPDWVFAPVWTAIYLMIGTAAWLVWRRVGNATPLRLWGWQLLVDALWTPAFFGLREPALGAVVILTLLALVVATVRAFDRVERRAALLMLPYAAWVAYASYLNIGIWWLNRR